LSPRNAEAISLKGFILAAQNRIDEELNFFDEAIAVDPAFDKITVVPGDEAKVEQTARTAA